jgi:hypothetical protein
MDKDEHYILNLCDKLLGLTSSRQHRFDFLRGDKNRNGITRTLPVDAYYINLNVVIEYRERQHTEAVLFFDKPHKLTVSGVDRGQQRKIYDDRRREVLPKHKITLIEFSFSEFNHDRRKRIIRNETFDTQIIKNKLTDFIKISSC